VHKIHQFKKLCSQIEPDALKALFIKGFGILTKEFINPMLFSQKSHN